jgi:hypothetical protein
LNAIRKAGIRATIVGLLALGGFKLDSDVYARSHGTAADTGVECGAPCSVDMTKFATPVGDGLVALMVDGFF